MAEAPRSVISKRLMAEIAFDEGGDVERATSADPTSEIEKLVRDKRTRSIKARPKGAVWHSNRAS